MGNIVETRKAINFDEGSRELELIYTKMTGKNPKSAWEDIGRELKKLGFVKDQYSGYVSSEPLTFPQAVACIKKLNNKLRWIKYCSLEFKLTEVTERFFSLNSFFAKSAKANKDKDAEEFGIKNIDELLKECRNYQKYNSYKK